MPVLCYEIKFRQRLKTYVNIGLQVFKEIIFIVINTECHTGRKITVRAIRPIRYVLRQFSHVKMFKRKTKTYTATVVSIIPPLIKIVTI